MVGEKQITQNTIAPTNGTNNERKEINATRKQIKILIRREEKRRGEIQAKRGPLCVHTQCQWYVVIPGWVSIPIHCIPNPLKQAPWDSCMECHNSQLSPFSPRFQQTGSITAAHQKHDSIFLRLRLSAIQRRVFRQFSLPVAPASKVSTGKHTRAGIWFPAFARADTEARAGFSWGTRMRVPFYWRQRAQLLKREKLVS